MKQSRELDEPVHHHFDPFHSLRARFMLKLSSEEAMVAHYNASHITLHVRKSNRAAISLYRDSLGFEVHVMEKGYC